VFGGLVVEQQFGVLRDGFQTAVFSHHDRQRMAYSGRGQCMAIPSQAKERMPTTMVSNASLKTSMCCLRPIRRRLNQRRARDPWPKIGGGLTTSIVLHGSGEIFGRNLLDSATGGRIVSLGEKDGLRRLRPARSEAARIRLFECPGRLCFQPNYARRCLAGLLLAVLARIESIFRSVFPNLDKVTFFL